MRTKHITILAALAVAALLLSGCSPAVVKTVVQTQVVKEEKEVRVAAATAKPTLPAAATLLAAAMEPTPTPGAPAGGEAPPSLPYRPNRLIIKNADLTLLVDDTDRAIDQITQIAADTGGYILSSRVWYQARTGEESKYATVTLRVPSDQFEQTLRRLRALAVRVIDETASGQDVTDEYVDLQSRLRNLEATRDRIRQFLDQAQTVEEALKVNRELSAVEAEIEQVQGRMNYLFDRAAYSTITIQIRADMPTPTPSSWDPGETAQRAGSALGTILQVLAELVIWFGIVVLPLVAPPALLCWLVVWLVRRRARRRNQKAPQVEGS